MEKQGRSGERKRKTALTTCKDWVPALWSVEAIVIGGGLALGVLVFATLAKPAFNEPQDRVVGYLFVVMSVLCPLIPSIGAAHIHGVHRKLGLPRKQKTQG